MSAEKHHRVPEEAREKWSKMAETTCPITTPGKCGGTRTKAALRMPPGINPEMFPDLTYEQLLLKSETARPTVNLRGNIIWVPKGEPLYLGKDVSDVGEKGLSDVFEVVGIVREMEKDFNSGLLTIRGLNARTLTLRLAMATIWAHHHKKRYGAQDKITPVNVPLLREAEVREGLKYISDVRLTYNLNVRDTVSWTAFQKLVKALRRNMKHPSVAQVKSQRKGARRIENKIKGMGTKKWEEMSPAERSERMPGGAPND